MNLPRLSRLLPLALAAFALRALAQEAVAQETAAQAAPAQALPEARTILDRFIEKTRARELVEKTTSMYVDGTMSLAGGQMEGTIEIWFKKPSQYRSEIELPMIGKMVQSCDGQTSWMTNAMIGARLSEGVELLQARLEANYSARLKPTEVFESARTASRETFDGRDCYKVELVLRPAEGMDVAGTLAQRTVLEFYDVETGMLAGSEVTTESDMFSGTVRTKYKEYAAYGGYPMARRTVVETGPQVIEITVESVDFDTVDDAIFVVPAEVQALIDRQKAKKADTKD
jgi:outer membrane lipoprotein-sorting protein